MGLKGLREKVEEPTSLPYDVILTHGHGDHAAGSVAFEKAYIFEKDYDVTMNS